MIRLSQSANVRRYYFKDYRSIIANVGDYCDEDGFFDEAEDDTFEAGQTRDLVNFGHAEKINVASVCTSSHIGLVTIY